MLSAALVEHIMYGVLRYVKRLLPLYFNIILHNNFRLSVSHNLKSLIRFRVINALLIICACFYWKLNAQRIYTGVSSPNIPLRSAI